MKIDLDEGVKQQLIEKLQAYFTENLDRELGGFEAQFLLDFFAEEIACYYYNQGLADAMTAMESKLQEVGDLIYELEKQPLQG